MTTLLGSLVFDLSKKQWGVEGGVWPGKGAMPLRRKFLIFFHFKIVQSGAFSYTNSKVLFAIKCRERYVIVVNLAIDSATDIKTSSFHQSRKPRPVNH